MIHQFVELSDNMHRSIKAGSSGLDIMHGELKNLMLEAEDELLVAQEREAETEEAMDSMERRYWEGQVDALAYLYGLTYSLSFAIQERDNK